MSDPPPIPLQKNQPTIIQTFSFKYNILLFFIALVFQVHRLVVVNEQRHVKGVVSLSDVLKYLVLTSHMDT